MRKFDWSKVSKEHVLRAINEFQLGNPEYPAARSTFLLYDGQKLPAKHIRGMAYKLAHGVAIKKDDYSGGVETKRFFENLGFEIFYLGDSVQAEEKVREPKQAKVSNTHFKVIEHSMLNKKSPDLKIRIPTKGVTEQKNSLQLLLNEVFNGDIVCEKTFTWMKAPKELDSDYTDIIEALMNYRGDTAFAKKNTALRCDFVSESQKLIIEYDERQHFTLARKLSLLAYPEINLGYNKELWLKACEDVKSKDNNPVNRDEIRAFYDSVRDIQAFRHGYRLVRIMHGQVDFQDSFGKAKLKELLFAATFYS